MTKWIWEQDAWPAFSFDAAALGVALEAAARETGRLHGRFEGFRSADQDRAALAILARDVLNSSAIEGERLDPEAVHASLAHRFGVDVPDGHCIDRHSDAVAQIAWDATQNCRMPVTAARLRAWQAALFSTGRRGMAGIRVGQWRNDEHGPMQVVSGPAGRQRVHFEAPPASALEAEIDAFLGWLERPAQVPALIKAGLAHLWVVTLHPFDDGNGRVARAVCDLMLSRAAGEPHRYYSLSARIQVEREAYYTILEKTQRGGLDVTEWLLWFLECVRRAVQSSAAELDLLLVEARFWQRVAHIPLTSRQLDALGKVLNEFTRPLTNRRWASLTGTSPDTALRDLRTLVDAGVLERAKGGGRAVAYWLAGVPRQD